MLHLRSVASSFIGFSPNISKMNRVRHQASCPVSRLAFLFALVLSSVFAFGQAPAITSVTPTSGVAGTQVTIAGSGFGATQGSGKVWLGSTYGVVVSWSDAQVVATIASGAKSGTGQVLQGGVWSNSVNLTVVTPTITSVTPTSGVAGTQVTIAGSGFGGAQGNGNVWLGSTYGVVVSWSDAQVMATIASGAKSGTAQILQGGVWSNSVNLTVVTPNITSVTPTTGVAGTQVTVTGSGFGATQGSGKVWLGSTYGVVVSWSDTQVVATIASGAKSGTVQVLQGGVWSNSVNLTVVTPNITSVTPTTGVAGTQITIAGSGFGATQGSGKVWLGSTYGVVVSWSDAQVVATIASGAKSGTVQVLQGGVWSNSVNLTVVTPNITSVTPTTGVAGTQITIAGSGFGATQGSGKVWLGSTYGVVVSWSDAQVVATIASGAKSGTVQVLQGGVWSNSVNLTVVTPNITSVTPTSGVAGTQVTITGSGFGATQGSGKVWLGSTYGVVVSWSDTQVVATIASGAKSGTAQILQGGVWSNSVNLTIGTSDFVPTTGTMSSSRYGQTATQLNNGNVLLAGGTDGSGILGTAELYTPTNQTFAPAGTMTVPRWLHTATLLNDGTVLIAGGSSLSNETTLNSAEIYDPVAGTFTLLPNTLNIARVGHTATLLVNGQVLIVGGYDPTTGIIADSELYDPTAQVFIDLGNTNTPRFHHTATLLQNGQVLITGGETDPTPSSAYNTAETFNPQTWTFSPVSANMISGREGHAATLLNDGTVLVTGGDLPGAGSLNTAEIYNPASGTFSAVSAAMTSARIFHAANLLNGGKVLLSGGENDSGGTSVALNSAEVYDPTAQTFTATGNLTSVREHQTATLLNDGTVLEDGGTDGTNVFNTAEIYADEQADRAHEHLHLARITHGTLGIAATPHGDGYLQRRRHAGPLLGTVGFLIYNCGYDEQRRNQ